MARRDGDLVARITAYADGPDEMREVIRHHIDLGVDQIKLSMSGEEVYQHPMLLLIMLTVDRLQRFDRLNIVISQTRRQRRALMKLMVWVADFVQTLEPVIR